MNVIFGTFKQQTNSRNQIIIISSFFIIPLVIAFANNPLSFFNTSGNFGSRIDKPLQRVQFWVTSKTISPDRKSVV